MDDVYSNYAQALFDLTKDQDLKSYIGALRGIEDLFAEYPELLKALCSYTISQKDQFVLAEEAFSPYRLPYLVDFLKVVIRHRRISHFHDIVKNYCSLANESLGIGEGLIYSATKLDKEQIARIEESLKKRLGKTVSLRNISDPSLLGGVKVSLEGKVYDGSLKNRLDSLHKQLSGNGGNP